MTPLICLVQTFSDRTHSLDFKFALGIEELAKQKNTPYVIILKKPHLS